MNSLPLERGITYGPIYSRRLGTSLGINLLPTTRMRTSASKTCSFDCVYCHYGRTPSPTMQPAVGQMPWPTDVVREVERALALRTAKRHLTIDTITFSGNGEPTLHPAFGEIAAEVRRLRDRLCPGVRLALFSNSTTLCRPGVIQALQHFDAPMMKLDAGDHHTFMAINRPAEAVRWDELLECMRSAPQIETQTVLLGGLVTNAAGEALDAWMEALNAIRPRRVYVHSTDYVVPEAGIERILPLELLRIAAMLERRCGLSAEPRWLRR